MIWQLRYSPLNILYKVMLFLNLFQASSESESGLFCMSSLSDDDDMGWSHSWPSTVWHCFLKGKGHKYTNTHCHILVLTFDLRLQIMATKIS